MTGGWMEKRKSTRVDARLNLEVQLPQPDGALETANLETINISSSGVYFRSSAFLEPMTKLAMRLEVPVAAESGVGVELAAVNCEGIVVRTDPEKSDPGVDDYESAVFFTQIDPSSLENLERHIAMLLGSE